MKERFLREGIRGFADHEVLEMLLYYALPYRNTNELGHTLRERFGSFNRVLDAPYEDLLSVPGVTPHVATLIRLCGQVAHRFMHNEYYLGELLHSTEKLVKCAMPFFAGARNEQVVLISMDNKRKLLNATRIFEGSVNSAQFNMRTAIHRALQDNATLVVLAHNHPNGLAIPSRDDLRTTRAFAEALRVVDIRLVDHLIVAENDCVSMADTKGLAIYLDPNTIIELPKVADRPKQ